MRADLHVHSYHSGFAKHLRVFRTRDCYSTPEEIYRTARARGMDLVTITDHDSVDGCLEFLDRHPDAPDFIVGEEITTWYGPVMVHLGALGMTERIHREMQPLCGDVQELSAYLSAQGVFTTVNHLFYFHRGQVDLLPYISGLMRLADGLETRNGAMLAAQNELIERVLAEGGAPLAALGGSDAHTLNRIGTTWTRVDASDRGNFLHKLRAGESVVEGVHGGTLRLAADIYGVIFNYFGSLVGLRRHSLRWPTRVLGGVCSVASIPILFIPLAVAILQKSGEAKRVARYQRVWSDSRSVELSTHEVSAA